MGDDYKTFLEHTESKLSRNTFLNPCFQNYQFHSELGEGYTAIYEIDSIASICIADHIYFEDIEYNVPTDSSIVLHQYNSIDSCHYNPEDNVFSGMQYIDYFPNKMKSNYTIKKDIPAKMIGIQLMPEYFEGYLQQQLGVKDLNLVNEIKKLPHGILIPELSLILNQIRNFYGGKYSSHLFFKSKIDEITALILKQTEEIYSLKQNISITDQKAMTNIIAYINLNFTQKLFMADLAKDAYMSISKFKYIFESFTGQTFSEYIIQKRMEYACDLLRNTNMYIFEVSILVGYQNVSSFSTQFKKIMGMSPLDYRCNSYEKLKLK